MPGRFPHPAGQSRSLTVRGTSLTASTCSSRAPDLDDDDRNQERTGSELRFNELPVADFE